MKVLVFGDVIVDKYVYGTSSRISPEAPVPIVNINKVSTSLGGAGLVLENLKNLDIDATLVHNNQNRSTKTRIISDGHYITRLDEDEHADADAVLEQILQSDFAPYDYVILSDYNKGALDHTQKIINHINTFGCKIIVDPKRHASEYEGAWLVKPNYSEFYKFGFDKWQGNIITTNAGKEVIANIDGVNYNIPVENVEVSDVTGAGDCFLAGFVFGLDKGYDYKKCLEIATRGSTVSVKHSGTYKLKKEDLESTVVFTNGCFDILHTGHFELLKAAKEKGDKLIVGLNDDRSVRRLKGDNRPINPVETRKKQLEILSWVDEVIVFSEDTPYDLIKSIKPNLIVKGGDYKVNEVVGHDLTSVYIVPTVEDFSTTNILEKINE